MQPSPLDTNEESTFLQSLERTESEIRELNNLNLKMMFAYNRINDRTIDQLREENAQLTRENIELKSQLEKYNKIFKKG